MWPWGRTHPLWVLVSCPQDGPLGPRNLQEAALSTRGRSRAGAGGTLVAVARPFPGRFRRRQAGPSRVQTLELDGLSSNPSSATRTHSRAVTCSKSHRPGLCICKRGMRTAPTSAYVPKHALERSPKGLREFISALPVKAPHWKHPISRRAAPIWAPSHGAPLGLGRGRDLTSTHSVSEPRRRNTKEARHTSVCTVRCPDSTRQAQNSSPGRSQEEAVPVGGPRQEGGTGGFQGANDA